SCAPRPRSPARRSSDLSMYSREGVDSDGSGAKPVRLIFRDHREWGRSSYLVMQAGDFDCYGACRVQVTVDDAAPRRMAANRPKRAEERTSELQSRENLV